MTIMDLPSVKKDFSELISQIQPWTLGQFVIWLDMRIAEYKVFGRMIMGTVSTFIIIYHKLFWMFSKFVAITNK